MWLVEHRRGVMHGSVAVGLIGVAAFGAAWSILPDFGTLSVQGTAFVMQEGPPQGQPENLVSEDTYAGVLRLRNDAGLTNADLAALELSQENAEAVLGRLIAWYETNQASLRSDRHAVLEAQQDLNETERLMRIGEGEGRVLDDLDDARTALNTAEATYQAACRQGGAHALAVAPSSTQQRWAGATEFPELPIELRYLSSLNAQRAVELTAAISGGGSLPSEALSAFEQSGADQVRDAITNHARGVSAAESAVLPVPWELREAERGEELPPD